MYSDHLLLDDVRIPLLMVFIFKVTVLVISSLFFPRGIGYPDLWPSQTCREPLDVTKNITFDVISGILTGKRVLRWI